MNENKSYVWESVKLEAIVRTHLSQLSMQINSDLRSGPSQIVGLLSENETSAGIFWISGERIIYISHVSIVYVLCIYKYNNNKEIRNIMENNEQ